MFLRCVLAETVHARSFSHGTRERSRPDPQRRTEVNVGLFAQRTGSAALLTTARVAVRALDCTATAGAVGQVSAGNARAFRAVAGAFSQPRSLGRTRGPTHGNELVIDQYRHCLNTRQRSYRTCDEKRV